MGMDVVPEMRTGRNRITKAVVIAAIKRVPLVSMRFIRVAIIPKIA